MFNIFISYRREDSEAHSGRIYDRLVTHYDEKAVFMDVDAIPLGVDFREHLDRAVGQCDVLLAVIGEHWLDVRFKDGPNQDQRRLDDPTDFVRIEIVSALERGIPVIPVLVGKASMPRGVDLPDCLKNLTFRNAAEVRSGQDFRDHVHRLIRGLEHLRKAKEEKEAEKRQQELLLQQRQEESRQKAELERKREQEEAARQRQELERLQKEGETRLAQLVREALDRTQGKPTKEDTAAANEICKRYRVENERANLIVRETRDLWQRERDEKEREQKRLEAARLKQEQEERLRREEEHRKAQDAAKAILEKVRADRVRREEEARHAHEEERLAREQEEIRCRNEIDRLAKAAAEEKQTRSYGFQRLAGDEVLTRPEFSENIGSFPTAYGLALQGLKLAHLQTNLLPAEERPISLWQRLIGRTPSGMSAWGIDLGQCALKALRLENVDGEPIATAFDCIEHPKIMSQPDADPEELSRQALETFLSRNETEGDVIAISVPGQSGLARFIKVPPVEEKKIADYMKFEAKQQIPFPLDEVVWDFQRLKKGDVVDGMALDTEVGLFAMKRDMIMRTIKQFKEVNLEIHIIQMAPLSLCNFVSYDLLGRGADLLEDSDESNECIVALEIGTDSSSLVITNGRRIIWQRPIPIGGNHFTRALTKEMKLTFAKAEHVKRNAAKSPELKKILSAVKQVLNDFVGEVQRSLGYFTNTHRNARIQYLIGMGNGFRLPGLQKFTQEKLQLEVRKLL